MRFPVVPRRLASVLTERAGQYPIVTVTGPRQSGKTTLCRGCFPEKPWISLENPDLRAEASDDPRGLLARLPEGAILDEVQRSPDLLSYLQGDVDDRPEARGRWIVTGSNNLLLLRSVTQSLAGRTALLNLLPLGLDELPETHLAGHTWSQVVHQGGYPAPLHREIPVDVWLGDYVRTYVDRDVRDVLRIGDLTTFEKFVRLCAGRTAQLVNTSSLGADAGITHSTARAWLSVLETAYLTFTLAPWTANLTTREVRSPKLYFWDTGLLCWLLGIRRADDVAQHPLRGAIFENLVVSELLKSDLHRGQRPAWWFYRDAKGLEVDAVRIEGSATTGLALEFKSGQTIAADMADALRTLVDRAARANPPITLRGALVYGGDENRSVSGFPAISWRALAQGTISGG